MMWILVLCFLLIFFGLGHIHASTNESSFDRRPNKHMQPSLTRSTRTPKRNDLITVHLGGPSFSSSRGMVGATNSWSPCKLKVKIPGAFVALKSLFSTRPQNQHLRSRMKLSSETEIDYIVREAKRLMGLKSNEITLGNINHQLRVDQIFTKPLHGYHKFHGNRIWGSSKMLSLKLHPND